MEQYQNPSRDPEFKYLKPDAARQSDFTYILRQMNSEYFESAESGRGLRLFQPTQLLELQKGEYARFEFNYTAFIEVGGHAFQLATDFSRVPETKFFSTPLSISGSGVHTKALLERDFDRCFLRHAETGFIVEEFDLDTSDKDRGANTIFHPLPGRTAAMLFHETLGYIYIGSERIGAYPKPQGTMTTSFRIFYGGPENWRESEVMSAVVSGRGLGNWRYETGIGDFFIPGPNSIGDPTHLFQGKTVSLVEIEEDRLDITSPHFEPAPFNVFRTLGVPAQWPPVEFSISL